MDYRLTWLATLIVFLAALVLGVISAFAIREGAARVLWAGLVSIIFVAAGTAAIVFNYSWMFTDASRAMAQTIAVGAFLTGVIYAIRAPA